MSLIRKYQSGGPLKPKGLLNSKKKPESAPSIGMMKSKIAYEYMKGNDSAKRMVNQNTDNYKFDGSEGVGLDRRFHGTHYMSSMGEYAVPFIQRDNKGKLIFNPKANFKNKESIKFDREVDARNFAEYYKKVAPAFRK